MFHNLQNKAQSRLGWRKNFRDDGVLGQVRHAMLLLAVMSLPTVAQTSFWTSTATPQIPAVTSDSKSVTLGLKFSSDAAGYVAGVRFYKGSQNSGTHVGTLWSGSGAALATVTFSGETPSGWQQANFSAPVPIAANTTYVISYSAPTGNYAADSSYAWSVMSASPLHVSGSSPGVYA